MKNGLVLTAVALFGTANLVVLASMSMVLIKVFEMTKEQEERRLLEEEIKRQQAKGLVDITTPQNPYNM